MHNLSQRPTRVDHMGDDSTAPHRIFKKNVTPTKAGIIDYVEFLSCDSETDWQTDRTKLGYERDTRTWLCQPCRVVVSTAHIYPPAPLFEHSAVLSDMLLNRPCRALTVLRPDFALSFAFLERFIELFLLFSCFWVLSPLFTLIPSAFTRSTLHWHRFRCCCFVLLSRSADWSFAADSEGSTTELTHKLPDRLGVCIALNTQQKTAKVFIAVISFV